MTLDEYNSYKERMSLAFGRIEEIKSEGADFACQNLFLYFERTADFILKIKENYEFIQAGGLDKAPLDELKKRNQDLFSDILDEAFDTSFANPAYAQKMLGDKLGQVLCVLYFELRSMIGFAYEGKLDELCIRGELFCEVYSQAEFFFEEEDKESLNMEKLGERIKDTLYWFASDYADVAAEKKVFESVSAGNGFAKNIIEKEDLSDLRYLYKYGLYISENELKIAKFLNGLSDEAINTMADTYTDGYIKGFALAGIDLSKKKTVALHYNIGFERMMRRAIQNFAGFGNRVSLKDGIKLEPAIFRRPESLLFGYSIYKSGFSSTSPNRQYEYDHKNDTALFFDRNYANRKLEVFRTAYEQYKDFAATYAGPAVVETFGEKLFDPENKPAAIKMSTEQEHLQLSHSRLMGELRRSYINEEERSFTIISFPIPEIGENFEKIFEETIRINTLDVTKYQNIQQVLIDTLDKAQYCEIEGFNGNYTSLRVELMKLNNPQKETKFENCLADVNIPLGEVFTSPKLEKTDGILYVKRVYLNGYEYRDLRIEFKDGCVTDYCCSNFKSVEENKNFIKENILFRFDSLPMGEFAIGTNTTAYTVAQKYNLFDKLPILIAEKTGPHFAIGDTCYSNCEDLKVYNPDGKEIVAKENTISAMRKTNPQKAYFNCHTDITIPYDELGALTAILYDGSRVPIIEKGRFVLPGTEKLNEALQ